MAKICPCKKLSTKGKPRPKSKATVIQQQQQQQKNKQSLEKKAVNKQHASEVGAQNASPSAIIIEPTSAQLKRRSIELEKCEREITVLDKPCKKNNNHNNNNNTAGRKKKKRARKAGKDKAKQAAPTHQAQPSSSPPLRPSSYIHATIPEAEATTTAAPAVQAVVSIECTPATPSVASESIQSASSSNNISQPHQHEVSVQVKKEEEEKEDEELKSLMQMSLGDWLSIFDPILEESYRQTEMIIKSSHERVIRTLSMEAALQGQHPEETARIIASMRVQHEQELEQRYADHCKRTADDKEAIHATHREDMARAAQRQERMERERNERERIKRAAEEDARRRDRRESDRQFARMIEDGDRLAERCRIAPLIRTRLVKHFADAG